MSTINEQGRASLRLEDEVACRLEPSLKPHYMAFDVPLSSILCFSRASRSTLRGTLLEKTTPVYDIVNKLYYSSYGITLVEIASDVVGDRLHHVVEQHQLRRGSSHLDPLVGLGSEVVSGLLDVDCTVMGEPSLLAELRRSQDAVELLLELLVRAQTLATLLQGRLVRLLDNAVSRLREGTEGPP